MKLILGTVQLGKKYSKFIVDKVDNDEAIQILEHCINNNIFTFDTAQIYGNSEKLLSNISSAVQGFFSSGFTSLIPNHTL